MPRAKELVRFIEPLITQARKGTLHARRLVFGDVEVRSDLPKDLAATLNEFRKPTPGAKSPVSD